jgi:TrmH family RNA methyltransferase
MGSIARVNVSYVDLNSFLSSTDLPVLAPYGGVNIYKTTLPQRGCSWAMKRMAFQKKL